MTTPHPRSSRALLIEATGNASTVDAAYARDLRKHDTFFWLDLTNVHEERTIEIATALGMSDDSVHHLVTLDQRSNFTESHEGVRWVSFAAEENGQIAQVRGVYTKSFLVTSHAEFSQGLSDAKHLYERLQDSDQDDGPLVLFMVLDALATTFEVVLARLDAQLDQLVAEMLGRPPLPGYVQQVLEVRQVITIIIRALGPYRRDLVGILGVIDRLPGMQVGTQQYLDSHRSHIASLFEAAYDCRDETRDAMQAFTTATSERQGEVINWLTIVAAVFLPLTFVTGYFGMNFPIIDHLNGNVPFIFFGICLPVLLVIMTLLILSFLVHRLGVRLIPSRLPHPLPGATPTDTHIDELKS